MSLYFLKWFSPTQSVFFIFVFFLTPQAYSGEENMAFWFARSKPKEGLWKESV